MEKNNFECLSCGNIECIESKDVLEDELGHYSICKTCDSTSDLNIK